MLAFCLTSGIRAQNKFTDTTVNVLPLFALKTNMLYGFGTLTPNLSAEIAVARRWTVEAAYSSHPWNSNTINKKRLTHGIARLETRYWPRERFHGHFVGVHGLYSEYNVNGVTLPSIPSVFERNYRYHGNAWGGGINYGYDLSLGRSWNIEFTAGVGLYRLNYDRFNCNGCDRDATPKKIIYFGPSRLGASVEFLIPPRDEKRVYAPPPPLPAVADASPRPQPAPQTLVQPVVVVVVAQNRPTVADRLSDEHAFVVPESRFNGDKPFDNAGDERLNASKIFFKAGRYDMDPDYLDNRRTLFEIEDAIRAITASVDSRVARIVVGGFASPEGGSEINNRLAGQRAEAVKKHIVVRTGIESHRIELYNGGVDWDTLRARIEASSMPAKRELLDIIDNVPVWDSRRNVGRLGTIMRMKGGSIYRELLREHFPYLRSGAFIKILYENHPVKY